jgi:hypothetical protein
MFKELDYATNDEVKKPTCSPLMDTVQDIAKIFFFF